MEFSEDKSLIIKFGRDAGSDTGTFDFLGFTVISDKSRSSKYCIKFYTRERKLKIKRVNVKKWLRQNIHTPIGELAKKLNENYEGIITTMDCRTIKKRMASIAIRDSE